VGKTPAREVVPQREYAVDAVVVALRMDTLPPVAFWKGGRGYMAHAASKK
jgi:hypothetical protein